MPRAKRVSSDGLIFHVLNRGNGKSAVFHKQGDYYSFLTVLGEAANSFDINVLAYCLMPNHFHLLLQPNKDDNLCKMMQWLMTCHVRRYHQHYATSGHVWQGRYKSFIVQEDQHLLTVARYIEGNPVRALLVPSARRWRWSSHRGRVRRQNDNIICPLPIELPGGWSDYVDTPMTSSDIEKLRRSVNRQAPFGTESWVQEMCENLGLESTVRERGRPRKLQK